jgi:hypothetical protein
VPVKINSQQDYFETKITVDPKCEVAEVSDVLKALKINCRIVVLYNGGAVQAINIEIHRKVNDEKSDQVRALLGLTSVLI